MKKLLIAGALLTTSLIAPSYAANYTIDNKGAHASINFKASHLGFSILTGRFNKLSGTFSYDDANIAASKITVNIDTSSIDSNHAERDKHIRSDDFLDAGKFSTAKFTSTKVEDKGNGKLSITGDFTLHGITKSLVIDAVKIGEGKDPWGGYRVGFSGTAKVTMGDFGFKKNFGTIDLDLYIEGIRN